MASSGGFRRKGFRSALGNTWRVPKVDLEGLFQRRVKRGFRGDDLRAGFRDRWHFPEDGPAGVSAEASKGGIRQGFGKVSKTPKRGGERSFGDTRHLPKGLRRGLSVGFRRGVRRKV